MLTAGGLPCPGILTQKLALKGAVVVCLRSDIDDFGRVSVASMPVFMSVIIASVYAVCVGSAAHIAHHGRKQPIGT